MGLLLDGLTVTVTVESEALLVAAFVLALHPQISRIAVMQLMRIENLCICLDTPKFDTMTRWLEEYRLVWFGATVRCSLLLHVTGGGLARVVLPLPGTAGHGHKTACVSSGVHPIFGAQALLSAPVLRKLASLLERASLRTSNPVALQREM
jgi:hypothetical protein